VILAIGLQGNLRPLGVPGEELPRVQYQLDDPQASTRDHRRRRRGRRGDRDAVALAEQNQVILINRNEEFARCKEGKPDAGAQRHQGRQDRVPLRHHGDESRGGRGRRAAAGSR